MFYPVFPCVLCVEIFFLVPKEDLKMRGECACIKAQPLRHRRTAMRARKSRPLALICFLLTFLLYIPSFLQAFLLWMLIRRKAQRAFPFFFAYTAFGVAAGIARYLALNHVRPYFWTYWITDSIYILLATATLFEISRSVFRNVTRAWWRLLFFPGIIAVSILLCIWRMNAVPPKLTGLTAWIVNGEIAVRFAQVITFAALGTLVLLLGLRWNRQERGITAGFGMYATIMLLMTTKYSDAGTGFRMAFWSVSVTSYSAALLIWIWSFHHPRRSTADTRANSEKQSNSPRTGSNLLLDSTSHDPTNELEPASQ
jgi:hypothetical protein